MLEANTSGAMTTIILTIANAVLAALAAFSAYWAYREQKRGTYIQFYGIVARHHEQELTSLRREVMTKLPAQAAEALRQNKSLLEIDSDLQLKVSTLANYYEGLGTFLKGGWRIFPREARVAMLEMLHNSVSQTWPVIDKYKEQIYPRRPADWAGSYRWLFDKVTEYRKQQQL